MNHYIIRNILIILGIPMTAYIILQAFSLYGIMTEDHGLAPIPTARIQFPLHNPWGVGGVNRFEAMSKDEQVGMLAFLDQSIAPLDPWLKHLGQDGFSLLCLGENHDGHLRNLVASRILPYLPTDILMIEADSTQAARMVRHTGRRTFVPLLGQDMGTVIKAAKAANPAARILGIEETRYQSDARRGGDGKSREKSIEQNLRSVFVPGKRHLVLYGAFHCSHRFKLYSRLQTDPPADGGGRMLNIRIAREHIEAPIEAFVYFLDEIGFLTKNLARDLAGDIVITDTAGVAARFRQWFPFMAANELEHYGALVIMRPLRYPLLPAPESDTTPP